MNPDSPSPDRYVRGLQSARVILGIASAIALVAEFYPWGGLNPEIPRTFATRVASTRIGIYIFDIRSTSWRGTDLVPLMIPLVDTLLLYTSPWLVRFYSNAGPLLTLVSIISTFFFLGHLVVLLFLHLVIPDPLPMAGLLLHTLALGILSLGFALLPFRKKKMPV